MDADTVILPKKFKLFLECLFSCLNFKLLDFQEYAPTDDELDAYRRGETWNAEKAKDLAKQRVITGGKDLMPNHKRELL